MPKKKTVPISEVPAWVKNDNIDKLTKEMLRFLIINTPNISISARAKVIASYGIEEDKYLSYLKDSIEKWKSSGNNVLEEQHLLEVDLLRFPPANANLSERICFSYKDDELIGLFTHIRNSLAHGRFNIAGSKSNPILVMEDINTSKNCSARMIIKIDTLKKWQNCLEKGL